MRRLTLTVLGAVMAVASAASAAPPPLRTALLPLSFLVGRWAGDGGKVESGGSDKGVIAIEPAVGGAALLSRGHTDLFNAKGSPSAGSTSFCWLIQTETSFTPTIWMAST